MDSKIQIIDKFAFSYSSIESISIPSGIIKFNEGWCTGTANLINISILE